MSLESILTDKCSHQIHRVASCAPTCRQRLLTVRWLVGTMFEFARGPVASVRKGAIPAWPRRGGHDD